MTVKPLTARDLETLSELAAVNKSHTEMDYRHGWARPMDCGGSNGSHHSATLTKLALRGLVTIQEASTKYPGRSKLGGGKNYKINDAGLAALKQSGKYDGFLMRLALTPEERSAEIDARLAKKGVKL